MAYDFGSKGLGITNPFKAEGLIRSIGGLCIALLGLYSLFKVTALTEHNLVAAWIYAGFGLVLLIMGLQRCGSGLFQLFKFFVGRSVPSSLALNLTKSEQENAELERRKGSLAYSAKTLESMLMGRKNTTFSEPKGWVGRLVHSIMPKLVFLPYPMRNVAQEIVAVLLQTVLALIAFALTYFVSSSGLAGKAGHIIIPIFSALILVYLLLCWRSAAKAVSLKRVKQLKDVGAASLAKVIAFSVIFPVIIGLIYHHVFAPSAHELQQWQSVTEQVVSFSAWPSLITLLALGAIASVALFYLLTTRAQQSNAQTEVSEYRANLQESVHPNEIFINIENIVLANRRYREIPNRTYIDFDPTLNEQSQGKGDFRGELLIETQPEFTPTPAPQGFKATRLFSTIAAQLCVVIGACLLFALAAKVQGLYDFLAQSWDNVDSFVRSAERGDGAAMQQWLGQLSALVVTLLSGFFFWQIFSTIGRMLENFSHVFWAELRFSSLLLYMKTEGTFTESKISTGMSIHDSTRSENVIVKSSITPWIVSSRIHTSTFASSGSDNVEMPRYVMTMEKNEQELNTIVDEIDGFLKGRETIAGFSNTADLQHAENILKVNQASRAEDGTPKLSDDKAGGFRERQDTQQLEENK
ncbi:hypothetical protein MHM93_18115 [Pseudoalteromonas sp. MM17-2]|uniref:hypothetical protein n=1 Tax=Pseudoalteromonas sp. MM17-2 TaxID=2917753 RepID=UPI001EF6F84F|nr:hypothetical protein [Pseudoalteromonas sp. MM17-2]MCG7546094.1 hypothetical protein [Pseudoalteromonas sp. MM17-2]